MPINRNATCKNILRATLLKILNKFKLITMHIITSSCVNAVHVATSILRQFSFYLSVKSMFFRVSYSSLKLFLFVPFTKKFFKFF